MCKSCCDAQHNRAVIFFAYFKGKLCVFLCFSTVGRLKNRQFCRKGNHSCVLFILRTVKPRVICHNKYKAAVYTYVRNAVYRVCRNVETNVFHTCHRTAACYGCTKCNLCRYLFVW